MKCPKEDYEEQYDDYKYCDCYYSEFSADGDWRCTFDSYKEYIDYTEKKKELKLYYWLLIVFKITLLTLFFSWIIF